MNKLKLFIENFVIYGIGGVISKIIPLIMIPLITRIMPSTEYFGISDLSNTLVQFGSALAIMGMYDAMYRMFFEREDETYKKHVCSTALSFTIFTSIIVFLVMIISRKQLALLFFGNRQYANVVYLSAMATLVGATNSIISAPTRMQNKRKVFLITNTIGPLLSYVIAIPMLLNGFYIIALPLAAVISGVSMELTFGILNHKWFTPKAFDLKTLTQLLIIGIPLLPNFLIYWVFNSCDKVMITNVLGVGFTGIYSVGSKLGHASQLIYTAFAGGWQYFAFSTMKESDQVRSNSLIFEYLGMVSFCVSSFMFAFSFPLFKVLFPIQYLEGYICAPYLFLAPLLQMLFQVASNQFLVVKKTWPNMFILSSGAVINIVLNIILIPILGIEGASVATLFGYFIAVVVCVFVLYQMRLMVVSKRLIVSTFIFIIFIMIWRTTLTTRYIASAVGATIVTFSILLLYKNDIKAFVGGLCRK